MDEILKVLQQIPKEVQDNMEKQYEVFMSMYPKGYVIGADLSSAPDQTGGIEHG